MDQIHGIPHQSFVRSPYQKMQGPPMEDGHEGPGSRRRA